jgi:hypothetical protein
MHAIRAIRRPRPARSTLLFTSFFLASFALVGCEPSCEDTCEKLLSCDGVESPRVSERECERACTTQQELYLSWDDVDLQTAFSDHKRCLDEQECSAIANGVCYDERLYAFPADEG